MAAFLLQPDQTEAVIARFESFIQLPRLGLYAKTALDDDTICTFTHIRGLLCYLTTHLSPNPGSSR